MNLFQSVLRNFEKLGICENQNWLNKKLLMTLACYLLNNISNCIFLVREVKNFNETVISIFALSTSTTITTSFIIIIFKATKLFDIVSNAEANCGKGKICFQKFLYR